MVSVIILSQYIPSCRQFYFQKPRTYFVIITCFEFLRRLDLYRNNYCTDQHMKNRMMYGRGGSRISRWGGANLRRVHFLAKTYAKTKEIDPVGGARVPAAPPPPGSANVWDTRHVYTHCEPLLYLACDYTRCCYRI